MQIRISDIQHFSVGDGDGIRTTVFFQGCNLHCPWCHNPETVPFEPVLLNYRETGKTEKKGRDVSAEEILPELLEDLDFFEESGGGVTFSGGEVMMQADGAVFLAGLLKEHGISVLIDTAGNVPYAAFEKMNRVADGYLYDYKTASAEKYRKVIGGDLNTVTDNLYRLLQTDLQIHVRIPLIPGFNTGKEEITEICVSLQKIGVKEVELLPFHRLGSAKYQAMGKDYPYKETRPLEKEELQKIKALYEGFLSVKTEF